MAIEWVDTHCHLNDSQRFPDPDRAIAEAADAGVTRLMVVGIDLHWSRKAVELADRHEGVFAVVGHHPTSKGFRDEHLKVYEEWFKHPKVVALGEIGLDYHWDMTTPEEQDGWLRAQLELAKSLGAPVIFHCREAYDALIARLDGYAHGPLDFHCFAGSFTQAEALGLHHYFGVDGPLTYPKAGDLREIVALLPKERILLETDAPWLPPVPYRGKLNHPAYLPLIGEALAQTWNVSVEEVARQTSANAEACFPKLAGGGGG